MDDLLIEDLDEDLIRQLQERALQSGRTVDQEVIYLLERGLLEEAKQAELARRQDAADRSGKNR
jgi:plasmid stability protein